MRRLCATCHVAPLRYLPCCSLQQMSEWGLHSQALQSVTWRLAVYRLLGGFSAACGCSGMTCLGPFGKSMVTSMCNRWVFPSHFSRLLWRLLCGHLALHVAVLMCVCHGPAYGYAHVCLSWPLCQVLCNQACAAHGRSHRSCRGCYGRSSVTVLCCTWLHLTDFS